MSVSGEFANLFDGAAFGLAILSREGELLDSNSTFRALCGTDAEAILRFHRGEFKELTEGKRNLVEFEQTSPVTAMDGAWIACALSPLQTDDRRISVLVRDITEVKENEQRMLHDMTHDPLTGLANRRLFESKLREALAACKASPPACLAAMTLDIDHFREINEGFGPEAGEFVVSQVGKRLASVVGQTDLVSHIGGEQFGIIAQSEADPRYVEVIARRIFSALAKPMQIGSQTLYVSASVGIAPVLRSYSRPEEIVRDAQIATRYAASSGGSRTAVFDSDMQLRVEQRLQLSNDMRAGLQRDEFYLVYQPIVRLEDGAFAGCEALLRWNHPLQGLLPPTEFIPIAEQVGLSTQIGRMVARLACRQLADWQRRGLSIRMNVNVAWPDLLEAEFEKSLITVANDFAIQPRQLTLEITENIVLTSGGRATLLVEGLRRHGFGICIDDFGTGYSSLHYLQRFKIDAMKIDKSFVSGSGGDIASEPIVKALLTLADGFGVRIVAEGIETERQAQALVQAGCEYGQGFFFSKPVTAVQLEAKYPGAFGK